ncbi:hypothetical protein Tco_1492068 [Tanacetum coccineum]
MVVPAIEEVAEPMVEAEEQMIAPVIDMEEDLAALFGEDDNFEDDDSEGFGEEEVWEMNEEWLMAPVTPPPVPFMPPPSTYEVGGTSTAAIEGHSLALPAPGLPVPPSMIEDLSTRMSNLEYGHGQLVKKVIASQMVQAVGRLEQVQTLQATVQQRDIQIQQLQTMMAEMSSREGTLMQCILGMDKRLAELEKKKPP